MVLGLTKKQAKQSLEFIMFSSSTLPKSGFATKLPFDASSITISQLLEKGILTIKILVFLVDKGLLVSHRDVGKAASVLPDDQVDLFRELVEQYVKRGGRALDYTGLVETSVGLRKSSFASYLISCGGSPSTAAVLKVAEFPNFDGMLLRSMASKSSAIARSELAMIGFAKNNAELVSIAFNAGVLDPISLDLCAVMSSRVVASNIKYIIKLLDAGAKPCTSADGSTTPIRSALESKILTSAQQVSIVCMLLESRESVSHLCSVYHKERWSPVHCATQLLINTGTVRYKH